MPNNSTFRSLNGDLDGLPKGMALRLLESGGDMSEFRAASPLPRDSQVLFDDAVMQAGMSKLIITEDLISAGLTAPLPQWLGVPSLGWRSSNRTGSATRSMQIKIRGERQVPALQEYFLPVYATLDDFSFGIRELAQSRRVGMPLDTAIATSATRNVNEAIEDQTVNGAGFGVTGNNVLMTAPGFLTAPVNKFEYGSNEAWDAAANAHTGEDIVDDILGMIEMLSDNNYDGPYRLYIPTSYALKLATDYKSATSGSILERILGINVADQANPLLTIRTAPSLPANYTLLIQMTSDVVDVVVGQTPTMLSWADNAELEFYYMILACVITRIKTDDNGNQGYVAGYTNWP